MAWAFLEVFRKSSSGGLRIRAKMRSPGISRGASEGNDELLAGGDTPSRISEKKAPIGDLAASFVGRAGKCPSGPRCNL